MKRLAAVALLLLAPRAGAGAAWSAAPGAPPRVLQVDAVLAQRLSAVEAVTAQEGAALRADQRLLATALLRQEALAAAGARLRGELASAAAGSRAAGDGGRSGAPVLALGQASRQSAGGHLLMRNSTDGQGAPASPIWFQDLSVHLVAQAFAALVGLRAFLPLAILVLGSAHWGDFPFKFHEDFHWLQYWPVVLLISACCVIEMVLDAIPGLARSLDLLMLVVKPVVAILIALAPQDHQGGDMRIVVAALAAFEAECVAIGKQVTTQITDVASRDRATSIRSLVEDAVVLTLAFLSLHFAVAAPLVIAGCMAFFFMMLTAWKTRDVINTPRTPRTPRK